MEKNVAGYKTVAKIAIPITLQALLQSSFSVVDEIMIGQMGSNEITGIGLGGGILRSGGKTKYILAIDLIGTWIFGVPLGFMAAFWWKLSIPYVYFILSLEECVRLAISLIAFKRRVWVNRL